MPVYNFSDMFDFAPTDMPELQKSAVNIEVIQEEKESYKQGQHPIIVLCLDCSGSMNATDTSEGVSRIELVKRYAKQFVNTDMIKAVDKQQVELCVICFDSKVTVFKSFAPMSEIGDDFSEIQAYGLTSLYSALIYAVYAARKRKNALTSEGASCFKPNIFVITDGVPCGDDDAKMKEPCRKILAKYVDKDENGKSKMNLVIIGMDQCDMRIMDELCADKKILALRNADAIEEAFKLMTASVAALSNSDVSNDISLAFEELTNMGVVPGTEKILNLHTN